MATFVSGVFTSSVPSGPVHSLATIYLEQKKRNTSKAHPLYVSTLGREAYGHPELIPSITKKEGTKKGTGEPKYFKIHR